MIGNPIIVGKAIRNLLRIVFSDTNTIYVANANDNTLSVINGTTRKVIGTITVGNSPIGIGVNDLTNTIYVANSGDNSVSVIDGAANKVVARVMFNIKPFNSGYVVCDNATDKGKCNADNDAPLQLCVNNPVNHEVTNSTACIDGYIQDGLRNLYLRLALLFSFAVMVFATMRVNVILTHIFSAVHYNSPQYLLSR